MIKAEPRRRRHPIIQYAEDARRAIQAAKRALPSHARTSKTERLELLRCLHDAVLSRAADLEEATILEYGAPVTRARWTARYAAESFLHAAGAAAGLLNIVTGRGEVVGAELTTNPDIAKISFTGSTAVGKAIVKAAADTDDRRPGTAARARGPCPPTLS
jgi:acyl-CoA reductase-like NAD-dependent aldehyde dehydrogenase